MKFLMQRLVVVVAVVSVVIACGGIAQAMPSFGSDCATCHGQFTPPASLATLPLSLIEIPAGGTGQIIFDVTDLPPHPAAIAVDGLAEPNLGATVGAGWASTPASGAPDRYSTEPFLTSNGSYVLDLAIAADAVLGDYIVDYRMAGGDGLTAEGWNIGAQDYIVRVVPEPATLALLLTGFGTVSLLALRRRRKRA